MVQLAIPEGFFVRTVFPPPPFRFESAVWDWLGKKYKMISGVGKGIYLVLLNEKLYFPLFHFMFPHLDFEVWGLAFDSCLQANYSSQLLGHNKGFIKLSNVIETAGIFLSLSSVQFSPLSRVRLFATPWAVAGQASLSITNSRSLLKLMFIELVLQSNHLILCCSLLLLPSIFPSIRVFSSESILCIRWPKYWCFSFSISPSNEYSGLISFRIDWFALPTV